MSVFEMIGGCIKDVVESSKNIPTDKLAVLGLILLGALSTRQNTTQQD